MSDVTITLPESITETETRIALAARLFEKGRLSCGQAAELAGYSKRTFMELLGKQHVAVINYPPEELTDDLDHA
jgi:predicted HTH domain antitoxin